MDVGIGGTDGGGAISEEIIRTLLAQGAMMEEKTTILVADDDHSILVLMQALLSRHGYDVRVANSGTQVLESVENVLPDLILLDIMMSDMSGYDVCERLKENVQTRDIPVIFISALSKMENKVSAFNLGGIDYITKPFWNEEVLARIRTHLALQDAREELEKKNTQLEQVNNELTREIAERKRTEEALYHHAARLKIQRELHQSILAAHSPETVAMAAIGRIRQLIPCQRTIAMTIGENGTIQTLAAESSGELETSNMDIYRELLEDTSLSDGRVRGSDDLSSLPRRSPMQQALYAAGVRSYIVVPLLMQGELAGTLHLEATQPQAFTHEHITIAAEIAISLELEILRAKLYLQAQKEKQRSNALLLNILPASVAEDLKETGTTTPQSFENVTICFADIVDFTTISSQYKPEVIINELSEIFTAFDDLVVQNQCERIKTNGDAYLAVCGMPDKNDEHAFNIVKSAIEMIKYITARNKHSEIKWQIRIGIHSGQAVGGVVGVRKYIYDVFGDTVNTAARMEDHSEPMRINVSQSTHRLVKDRFSFIERESAQVKGKGEMQMYFVDW